MSIKWTKTYIDQLALCCSGLTYLIDKNILYTESWYFKTAMLAPFQTRVQKIHSSSRNYKWNLERTSNSSQSTCPVGQVLWEDLLEEVI